MSEHRRKPPQSNSGGRAANRRGAQPPPPPASSGRRSAPPRGGGGSYGSGQSYGADRPTGSTRQYGTGQSSTGSRSGGAPERPYGGRAEARRAAQRSGRRRAGGPGNGGGRGPGGPKPKRLIDYPRWGKDGWHRWVPSWKQSLGICVAFCGTMVALVGVAYLLISVPNANAAATSQKNTYYWDDGSTMVVSGGGQYNREVVQLDQIPKSMQNAVVSAENATFWTDSGVDPQGIARAVVKMAEGGETQSGSTITQQYVKNYYLDQNQTVTRKLKEILISIKVGAEKPKTEILQGYLNTGYYGRGAYGIQAASQAYYGINCNKLNASQSAFLAALLNGPNLNDPYGGVGPGASPAENRKRAEARWSWILDREVVTGDLTKAERAQYTKFPMPQPLKPATNKAGEIGYLTDLADNYVTANAGITQAQLDHGGYQIYTTFDKRDVAAMKKAVIDETKSIDPKKRPSTDKYVQFGGASVVPGDGAIKAIYGGSDYLEHFTDNADYTGAQVGSTFKPYVLAAAMQYGVLNPKDPPDQPNSDRTQVSPESMYPGKNKMTVHNYDGTVWKDSKGKEWLQANDESENLPSTTLRYAMEQSINSTYVQLGMDVGLKMVKKSAESAGIPDNQLTNSSVPSFSIGTSSPSAIRMAAGYATFASHGMHYEPYSVKSVKQDGNTKYQHPMKPTSAYSSQVADTVTNVLQGVVQRGTGTVARALDRPAAGKTGTTDSNKSAWFTGYTPQLATSIAMFRMDSNAKKPVFLQMYGVGGNAKIFGASYPTEIWTDYMKMAMATKPVEQFATPAPFGTVVDAHGATPTPSAPPSPTATPSTTPSTLPSMSTSPLPGPSDTCGFFGSCGNNGGGNGTTGGGGVPSDTPSTGTTTGSTRGTTSGGNTGGWLGGSNG
jgi:membrane peptidoglycan carboxypeptidase